MKFMLPILIMVFSILLPSFASASLVQDKYTGDYGVVKQTGNESVFEVDMKKVGIDLESSSGLWDWILNLFGSGDDESIEGTQICIKTTWDDDSYPRNIPLYINEITTAEYYDFEVEEEIEEEEIKYKIEFCYTANPLEDFHLKFGEDSIIIIQITSAMHLNSTRGYIADIFEYVNESDGILYNIPDQEYARVTFEQSLNNQSRIDVFVNNSNGSIEIYLNDTDTMVGRQENVTIGWYYINLNNTINYTTFDLKTIGNISYDLIIDPPQPPTWIGTLEVSPGSVYVGENITYEGEGEDPDGEDIAMFVCTTNSIESNPSDPACSVGTLCSTGYTSEPSTFKCNYTAQESDIGVLYVWGFICDSTKRCSASSSNDNYVQALPQPVISILSPTNNSNWNISSLTFNISADKEISWCGLSILGNTNQTMTMNASSTGASYTNSSIGDGSYSFIIACNDTANTFGHSELNYFEIDTVYPNISFVDPTPSNGSKSLEILANVSSSDTNNISTFIDLDNSLVGWWRMDEVNASGDLVDYLGRINGSKQGDASQTDSGRFGKGFEFGGVGDSINLSINPILDINTNITISAWIKTKSTSAGTWHFIIGGYLTASPWPGYGFGVNTNTLRYFGSGAGAIWFISETTTLDDGNWHHVVVSVNDTNTTLYSDGVVIGRNISAIPDSWAGAKTIGSTTKGEGNANGTIDDLMIFNRSLSEEEIKSLYANQSSRNLYVNYSTLYDFGLGSNHTLIAYTQDIAGNVNATDYRTIEIGEEEADTTNPLITIISPEAINYSQSFMEFNLSSNESLSFCSFSLNEGLLNYTMTINASLTGSNHTNSSLGDGNYLAEFWCNDTSNNINDSESVNFTLDTSPPIFDIGSPYNMEIYDNSSIIQQVNATDTTLRVDCFDVNDTNFNINCSGYLINSSSLSIATYYLNISVNDTLNNVNSSVISVNVISSIIPEDTCTYLNNSGNWNITDYCEFTGKNWQIDGNLSILSGGFLNITNGTLDFTSTDQYIIFENATNANKLLLKEYSRIN